MHWRCRKIPLFFCIFAINFPLTVYLRAGGLYLGMSRKGSTSKVQFAPLQAGTELAPATSTGREIAALGLARTTAHPGIRAARLLEAAPSLCGFRLRVVLLHLAEQEQIHQCEQNPPAANPTCSDPAGRTNCTERERGFIQRPRKLEGTLEIISPLPTCFLFPSHLN